VLSFSEAIANELHGTGVTVTALCPGPTRSGFQSRAQMEDSRLVAGRRIMHPRAVARAGYAGMMRGKTIIIPGAGNRLVALSARFMPRNLTTRLVRLAQERVSRHAVDA
jgi:short-subunit dehydrogenase